MPDDVTLAVAGRAFDGWKSIRVARSIESASGSFDLAVSERFGIDPELRKIRPGQRCAVRIDGETLITGHVDEVSVSIDDASHGIAVRGRDSIADLIDSAPDLEPASQWLNVSLLELAQRLAQPFGVSVRSEVDLGARFDMVALSAGQHAWELIEQQARYRQALGISDGRGGLVFTRAGTRRVDTAIVEGENMLRGEAVYSWADRFSQYIVKGQGLDLGVQSNVLSGQAQGTAEDPQLVRAKRHRPLVIVADHMVDTQRCIQRAQWEALTRAARGDRATVDVRGWRDGAGKLWPLNRLIALRSASLGLADDFLIASVAYVLDERGSLATLSLVRRDAFTVAPVPEPKPYGYQGTLAAAAAGAEASSGGGGGDTGEGG